MNKVSKGTIIRTIVLAIALINQILVVFGKSPLPIDEALVEQLVSSVFTLVVAVISFWKNNSYTQSAIKADEHMKNLKKKGK